MIGAIRFRALRQHRTAIAPLHHRYKATLRSLPVAGPRSRTLGTCTRSYFLGSDRHELSIDIRGLCGCLRPRHAGGPGAGSSGRPFRRPSSSRRTPIKHLVVIFQENVSFDHYFGTYPKAQNKPGETPFSGLAAHAEGINTLLTPLDVTHHFARSPASISSTTTPTTIRPRPATARRTAPPPKSVPPVARAGADQRPGTQREPGRERLRQRQDGRVSGLGRHRRTAAGRHRHQAW